MSMHADWQDGWTIRRTIVQLKLTRGTKFHFNHGGVLRGLLSAALNLHELPSGIVPFAPESGRVEFEAGDLYNLGLTFVGNADAQESALVVGLMKVGRSRAGATLAGNFDLVGTRQLATPDIGADVARIRGRSSLTLRFLSPFRLERPPALRAPHRSYLTADCFPVDQFLGRLFKRLFMLRSGRYPEAEEEAANRAVIPPEVGTSDPHLLWLDVPIESQPRPGREKGYTLGGLVGTITLHGIPEAWLQPLVLGRYAHAGEAANYGFGRYRLCVDPLESAEDFAPASSLIARAASPTRLAEAFAHLREHSHAAGIDGESPESLDTDGGRTLSELSTSLTNGTYRPADLLGFLQRRPDGRLRPLAIPTIRDRIAQRAVHSVLAPSIDTILEDCSFAYRKGLSRQSAARAIEEAWGQGFRYVLDADISAFFDTVEWDRLFGKLHALFPYEPGLELIKAWVKAPVSFNDRRIVRTRGLPQGAPLSPVLANLFLDEFDEELLGQDFRLVRYADDFVILCKDLDAARDAREQVQRALERIGLSLRDDKTAIRAIDSGFSYLGYLFCRSVVTEDKPIALPADLDLPADAVPSASWLAQVPFEQVKAIAAQQRRPRRARTDPIALQSPQASGLEKRPLYVSNADTRVSLHDETLVLERGGDSRMECPVRTLSHVTFVGRVRATLPIVVKLHELGVPVYMCRRSGEVLTSFEPHAPDWPLWLAQARLQQNGGARLAAARALVAAKLNNTAGLIRRFPVPNRQAAVTALTALEEEALQAADRDSLAGYEGRGAAVFFDVLRTHIDPTWDFLGRRRRPPPDPVNSMLSFGYTMLYNHASTAIVTNGLNPRIGFYHQEHGAHHALASDLMEPFRFLIEGIVWAMIKRREVTPVDFLAPAEGGACLMTHEFRRTFIARVEHRLLMVHTPRPGAPETYRETIDRAARQMREFVAGRAHAIDPFRAGDRGSPRQEPPREL